MPRFASHSLPSPRPVSWSTFHLTSPVAVVACPASYKVDLDSVVAAFDVETGKPRWDLGSRYRGSEVVLTAGDVEVFRLNDQEVTHVAVLDALEAVGRDRIFVNGTGGQFYAVDLAGRKVDQQLPGRPTSPTRLKFVIQGTERSEGPRRH